VFRQIGGFSIGNQAVVDQGEPVAEGFEASPDGHFLICCELIKPTGFDLSGHPSGLALTPARTTPHSQKPEAGPRSTPNRKQVQDQLKVTPLILPISG
jgi:hypothetical protein